MRVLVLGGAGFIGSHIIDGLLDEPDVEVWSMDRSVERFRQTPVAVKCFRNEFGNRGAQEEIISQGIDTIIHLISSTIPASSNKDPVFDVQSNLIETIELLNLAVKYHVRRVVFVSSGGTIYGDQQQQPIPESASLWPLCSYGIVKSGIEKYMHMYHQLYGLETVSVRLANPFGPRQDPTRPLGSVSVFLYRYLNRQPIEIWGDGNTVRDYVYIEDVKRAVLKCVLADSPSPCYNIGSGRGVSLHGVLQAMRSIGLDAEVRYFAPRQCDIRSVVLDCSRAHDELAWKAEVGFVEGVEKNYIWLRGMLKSGQIE